MSSVAKPIDNRVVERIEQLSENWSLFSTLTGAVMAGWVIVTALMFAVVLDILFQFETSSRVIVISIWCAVSLLALLFMMVRPLLRRRTLEGMARRLEQIFPELGSDLINLVQLSREENCPSQFLRQAALRQATRNAESVSLTSAPHKLTWRERIQLSMQTPRDLVLAFVIGLLISGLGGACHVLFPAWPNAVYRLFHPTRFVPTMGSVGILEVTPGDQDVLSGTALTVAAKVENPQHQTVEGNVVTMSPDGQEQRYALIPSEQFDQFSFTFPKVTDAFRYRLEIGGTQTDHYQISVFDRPTIRSLSATYRYPAYTGLAEQTVELKAGAIEAPQYTKVELTIETVALTQNAIVRVGTQEIEGVSRLTKPEATAKFSVTEDGFYTIHLTDERGNTNDDSARYPIHITLDQAPQIDITTPAPEVTVGAGETITIEVRASDDYGLSEVELRNRLETADAGAEEALQVWESFRDPKQSRLRFNWTLPDSLSGGTVMLYRAVAHDNRDASVNGDHIGPQEASTTVRRIRIIDRDSYFANKLQTLEQFRQELWRIYKRQTTTRAQTTPLTTAIRLSETERKSSASIQQSQKEIEDRTVKLADGIADEQAVLAPFKVALSNLAEGRMNEANGRAEELAGSDAVEAMHTSASELVNVQDDILDILRKLLDIARTETSKTVAQMEKRPGGDLPDDVAGHLEDLSEKLKEFVKEQRKVIEATEDLAKKPVEDFTEEEEQKLKDLAATEDEWSKFMNEAHTDLSKVPEQDFSNPSMLDELIEIETEIKMAEDALTKKTAEIAVPLEQLGAEMAEEIATNLEKWLPDEPDREQWSQEEPLTDAMREAPMAELPTELQDLVGELMEEEEDLFDEMEDVSSSWADSLDKGAGWDVADGPISNMSAKGATGNRLPNTSEIGGRSGEGRSGKSSGEFVGEEAVGKGGRKTPTRLTPDPFEAGQVKDTSTDPVGGSTGGGKESGQGGEGLEGPVPPPLKRDLQRLAGQQATLRNRAETVRLQFKIANYNTTDLDTMIDQMGRVEEQLRSGYFRSALRRRDVMLESLGDLRNQVTESAEFKTDTTANVPLEIRKKILGNMNEDSPSGWEQLNQSYFDRIANGK